MTTTNSRRSRPEKGFTLIEVMIVVAIVSILASLAYPSYSKYVIRSKRSAAQAQMMDIAIRQEQFLMINRAYASKSTLEASGYALPADVSTSYSYSITTTNSVPAFTLTFNPIGAQISDGPLSIDQAGRKLPAGKW